MRNELANTGKLLADEHVQDAGATESGAQEHLGAAGRVGLGHAPDNGGVVTIAANAASASSAATTQTILPSLATCITS